MRQLFFITILLCSTAEFFGYDILRSRHPRMAFTLDVSPKAGFGNTFFLNSNVDADPNANRYFFCPSYFYGGRLGLTYISGFPKSIFFTVYGEYLFSNFSQKYQLLDYATQTTYDYSYKIAAAHKALMVRATIFSRHDNGGAMYLEVGKQFSTIDKASVSSSNSLSNLGANPDVWFPKQNNNIVFGVGGHGLMYSLGLRFTYGRGPLFNGTRQPVQDGYYDNPMINPDYAKNYSGYKETHLLMVELVFELNLYILELGNATCGKQRLFPFPMHLNQDVIW